MRIETKINETKQIFMDITSSDLEEFKQFDMLMTTWQDDGFSIDSVSCGNGVLIVYLSKLSTE